ncbi:MAG: hypothetical protein ACYDIA_01900 [Candidatus Humimicrobiaceae bacterium]
MSKTLIKKSTLKHKSNKAMKKRLLDLWTTIVKRKGECEICGNKNYLNAHHIISKTNFTLKWDIRNGCCLCAGCHIFNRLSAHLDPLFFVLWLQEHRKDDYEYLLVKKNERFSKDYETIEKLLKEAEND